MIDPKKTYQLRDPSVGKLVSELYAFYVEGLRYKVSGVVRLADGDLAVYSWLPDGRFLESPRPLESNFDLVEAAWYEELKDGDPVLVSGPCQSPWHRRHFAYVNCAGNAMTYANGKSRWVSTAYGNAPTLEEWVHARKPTPEELGE